VFLLPLARSALRNLARPARRTAELAMWPGTECFAARKQAPLARRPAKAWFAAQAPRSNLLRAAPAPIGPALPGPWAPDLSGFALLALRAPPAQPEMGWQASFALLRLRR
jgi:hypothetical protein